MPKESVENLREQERDISAEIQQYTQEGNVDKLMEIAVILNEKGRADEAQKVYNKAIEIMQAKNESQE